MAEGESPCEDRGQKRRLDALHQCFGMESYTIVKKSMLSKIFRKEGPIHPMNKLFQATLLTTVFVVSSHAQTITTTTFGSGANEFNIEFVEIGETGLDPNDYGRGQVNYVYNLGKYEISRDMITKANAAGSLGISLNDMTFQGGNGPNRPATGISWREAAQFVNWLNINKGYQVAYNLGTTGNGDLQLWNEGSYVGTNRYRHKEAFYFLPSVDEWYKGGYGNPDKWGWNGYPTANGGAPAMVTGGLTGAVYGQSYSTGSPANINDAGELSYFGTMGQGGNVAEWTETNRGGVNDIDGAAGATLILRGGSWSSDLSELIFRSDLTINSAWTGYENSTIGFRIASAAVPEPSALSLLAVGMGLVLRRSRRAI